MKSCTTAPFRTLKVTTICFMTFSIRLLGRSCGRDLLDAEVASRAGPVETAFLPLVSRSVFREIA